MEQMSQMYRVILEVDSVLTLDSTDLSLEQAQARREELLLSGVSWRFLQISPIDASNENMFTEEQSPQ